MLSHAPEPTTTPADLSWSQVCRFLLSIGPQLELQDPDGNAFVVLTRRRYDELRAAADHGNCTPGPEFRVVALTERERESLHLIAQGLTTADAARTMGVAANTVAQHLAAARRRYGVRSSMAAAVAARAQGLIA